MPDAPPPPVVPPRRRPKKPKGQTVSTWLAGPDHDRLLAVARARDLSLSALIRRILTYRPRP